MKRAMVQFRNKGVMPPTKEFTYACRLGRSLVRRCRVNIMHSGLDMDELRLNLPGIDQLDMDSSAVRHIAGHKG
jgi:hypothetical protein